MCWKLAPQCKCWEVMDSLIRLQMNIFIEKWHHFSWDQIRFSRSGWVTRPVGCYKPGWLPSLLQTCSFSMYWLYLPLLSHDVALPGALSRSQEDASTMLDLQNYKEQTQINLYFLFWKKVCFVYLKSSVTERDGGSEREKEILCLLIHSLSGHSDQG